MQKQIKSGIILAGGEGTRLMPLTRIYNKHMIPIYNRFLIDYPIDTIKSLGVTDLTVVLGGPHFAQVVSHLKDGQDFGINISYVYQDKPIGIAQAINLCKRFVINDKNFAVILGDNVFELPIELNDTPASQIVLSRHQEIHRFGVASLIDNKIVSIEEKPKELFSLPNKQISHFAITGCYIFDEMFFEYFKMIKMSSRGEYEVAHIIDHYNNDEKLSYSFANGMWSDCGTHKTIDFVNNFFYEKHHRDDI
jgi:glucose-1-phosphate thymidylyltransferase